MWTQYAVIEPDQFDPTLGTAAEFKVISKSEIETSVPSGATAGSVRVTTTVEGIKNTLKSNTTFQVTE